MNILFVCTGNICRSPLAAGLMRVRLDALLPGNGITVASAGVGATLGPVPIEVEEVAAELGVDLSGHLSRQVDPDEVAGATLIVGMTRDHVRKVSLEVAGAFSRTFTLRELIRRADMLGGPRDDETIDSWVARLADGRQTTDLLGASPEDDVADPYGRPRSAYEEMAVTLDDLISQLAPVVAGR